MYPYPFANYAEIQVNKADSVITESMQQIGYAINNAYLRALLAEYDAVNATTFNSTHHSYMGESLELELENILKKSPYTLGGDYCANRVHWGKIEVETDPTGHIVTKISGMDFIAPVRTFDDFKKKLEKNLAENSTIMADGIRRPRQKCACKKCNA